jgi:NADPH:quinone reductase-like Zn-dependent oxidoreductase
VKIKIKMKAIVYEKYGPPEVLRYKEVEKPVPADDQVLIKIHAASINAADWHLLTADIFLIRFMTGFLKPKNQIFGEDISGIVEAVGKNVTKFQPGDEVFGDIFGTGTGGYAEYACASENAVVIKPASLLFEEAAALPMASVTALQGLRDKGQIKPGAKVLINGASGGVGSFAVQIARSFNAEVTAVCSTGKMEMARSLGADHVIDYTKEDFTKNGQQYDLILAANGYHPIADYHRALSPNGKYVMAGGSVGQMFGAMLLGPLYSRKGKEMGALSAKPNSKDLNFIKDLFEAGKLKPLIDKVFPLSEAVEAFRYFGEGHTRGKVVFTMTE